MAITLTSGLTIGSGITFGSGSGGGGGGTSFTVYPSDIQVKGNGVHFYGYSNVSQTDFTSDGDMIYNGVVYNITNPTLYNQIIQAYNGNDITYSYAWDVTWTIGGSGIVRIGFDGAGPNTLVIAPIDQTNTTWQTGDTNSPTKTGTFGFPATFTLHSPITQLTNNTYWC